MLTIKGINGEVQVDHANDYIRSTDNPERFKHEIYVHGGNLLFKFQGLAPQEEYDVELGFAELFYKIAGKRKQHVYINNEQVLANFDILKETQPYTGLVKSFKTKATSQGEIELLLETSDTNCADICNIKVGNEKLAFDFVAGSKVLKVAKGGNETEVPVDIVD